MSAGAAAEGTSRGLELGAALAMLAAVWLLLALAPVPTWPLWLAHFLALETVGFAAVIAILGLIVARSWRLRSRLRAAVLAVALAVVAMTAVILAGQSGGGFDLARYAFASDTPPVTMRADVILDPQRSDLVADVYAPAAERANARPFVVIVHGGSWRGGDKGEVAGVSRALAARGIVVFDLRYRLAPDHAFPAGIADVKCALGRIRERAGEWTLDPARAALLGRSAGGQMVAVAAFSSGRPEITPSCAVPDQPVAALVAVYGMHDPMRAHDEPGVFDVIDSPESVRLYLGGSPAERSESLRLATSRSWIDEGTDAPHTLLVHGLLDRAVDPDHSAQLAAAMRAAGKSVELELIPFADHAFDHREGGAAEQRARRAIVEFLVDRLRP